MRTPTLSILGLYNLDNTLFENMELPEGLESNIFIMNLLAECAENEVLYTDIPTFKAIIGYWSSARLSDWERIYDTLTENYKALWNTDKTVKETRNLANSNDVVYSVKGYNVDTLTVSNQSEGDGTDTGTVTTETYGNIGVTQTQVMVDAEIDLRIRQNIYDIIIREFKKRFIIMLY